MEQISNKQLEFPEDARFTSLINSDIEYVQKYGNVPIHQCLPSDQGLHHKIRVYSPHRLHFSVSTQKRNLLSLTRAPMPSSIRTEVTKTAHSPIFSTEMLYAVCVAAATAASSSTSKT